MTEKQFRKKVIKLGGAIQEPSLIVSFPATLRIETQSNAVDLLDIMRNDLSGTAGEYTIDLDEPLNALKAAIKTGVLYGGNGTDGNKPAQVRRESPGRMPRQQKQRRIRQ